jgi:hypothetical protein
MIMQAFDAKWGSKGGTYKTTPYFTKRDTVALYNPAGQKECSMEAGELADSFSSFTTAPVNVKKKMYIYLITKQTGQIIAVETNLTIGIEQSQGFKKNGMVNDYWIKLTPTIYSVKDDDIKKSHKYLGALAVTNPPKYAKMSASAPLDEETILKHDVIAKVDTFAEWKKQIYSGKSAEENTQAKPEITPSAQADANNYQAKTDAAVAGMVPENIPSNSNEDLPPDPNGDFEISDDGDDLPF